MTYPSQNFYPGLEARRSVIEGYGAGRAVAVASRKAAAAVEHARHAAGSLVETYTYWRRVQTTARQLAALDDAALRDIGLDRSQIPSVAHHLALAGQRSRR